MSTASVLNAPAARRTASSAMNPLQRILATTDSLAPTVARLTLGLVMFPHGAQKALGWFGGYGYSGTMGFFTGTMHIPAVFAFLAIAAEFAGTLALIAGAFSRVAALGIAGVMAVAIATTHLPFGFFMNWNGAQKGEGFEYHLLTLGLALIVLVWGGGKASLDRRLART
jgi:putative oxidoreductase